TLGSPSFMAPEQGADASQVDPRSDLYSLGCTLFYLLTGQPPFPGRNMGEVLLKHLKEPPPPLRKFCPSAPAGLEALVRKLLAKQPAERPGSAQEVGTALQAFTRPPAAGFGLVTWLILTAVVTALTVGGIVAYKMLVP